MNTHRPDLWTVFEIEYEVDNKTYKENRVFSGWHGGFTTGDSWRLSTEIVSKTYDPNLGIYTVLCKSGSVYNLMSEVERMNAYMTSIKQALERDSVKFRKISINDIKESA